MNIDIITQFSEIYYIPATFAALLVGTVALVYNIRSLVKVTVNCWFCNQNCKVPHQNKNCFLCPSCKQYNGFNEDGSYNREIAAQGYTSLNPTYKTVSGKNKVSQPDALCSRCNLNQSLKVQCLANFIPFKEENYDMEIEEYKQRLEIMYGLCRGCKAKLHQALGKQDSWLKPQLITWRLQQSKVQMLKAVKEIGKQHWSCKLVSLALTLLSIGLLGCCLFQTNVVSKVYLPSELKPFQFVVAQNSVLCCNAAIFVVFGLFIVRGKDVLKIADIVCCLAWISLIAIPSLKPYLSQSSHRDMLVLMHVSTIIFNIWMATTPRISKHARFCKTKREDLSDGYYDLSSSCVDSLGEDQEISFTSPSPQPSVKQTKSEKSPNSTLDSFVDLNIGTPRKSPSEFSTKSIFSDRPKIVSDPKLLSTQASWVAGGYWGTKQSPQKTQIQERCPPVFSASRSSSQSSGFVSSGNGFGADDHASITSETVGSWKRDAPSACSYYSQPSRPPSPLELENLSLKLHETNQSMIHYEFRKLYESSALQMRSNPWVSFLLGVSITANIFLGLDYIKVAS